jgi:hypothetical protein
MLKSAPSKIEDRIKCHEVLRIGLARQSDVQLLDQVCTLFSERNLVARLRVISAKGNPSVDTSSHVPFGSNNLTYARTI